MQAAERQTRVLSWRAICGVLAVAMLASVLVQSPAGATSAGPGAPVAVSTAVGDGTVTVSWGAPSDDGGSPIVSYTATASDATTAVTTVTTPGASQTWAVLTGLTNGTNYAI